MTPDERKRYVEMATKCIRCELSPAVIALDAEVTRLQAIAEKAKEAFVKWNYGDEYDVMHEMNKLLEANNANG